MRISCVPLRPSFLCPLQSHSRLVAASCCKASPFSCPPYGTTPLSAPLFPAGFFQDKAADAKARGEVPKSKKDLDKVGAVPCWTMTSEDG